MRIIGLHGKAGSGKDTACGYMLEFFQRRDVDARREGFADRLKVSAARALGFEGEPAACIDFCNALKREGASLTVNSADPFVQGRTVSGREYLQLYGTEAHRDVFGQDFWVDMLFAPYQSALDAQAPTPDVLIITDVRFPNEARAVHDRGGEIWIVRRPGSGAGDHASEVELSPETIDLTVENNGTLDDLELRVQLLCEFEPELHVA